jgi:site-specific DNA-methyltransferase (adenine-specific)
MVDLLCANAVEWACSYRGEPFHALLCDPPYELKFMGRNWDNSGVAFDPETWAAFLSVMYPGAFGMAFASSRGWHRLACAIEDAGFVIHPSIFGWAYGSGFPKATRVNHGDPHTETFAGHRYGLQALKPALEPIIVFQKPYQGRPIENITRTGAGVLNVDGGRIGTDDGTRNRPPAKPTSTTFAQDEWTSNPENRKPFDANGSGRWPANFYCDAEAARRLDEQSGESVSKRSQRGAVEIFKKPNGWIGESTERGIDDSGGASRFFFRVEETLDAADPVRYQAKASRAERDAGLDGFEKVPSYMVENGSKTAGAANGVRYDRTTMLHNPHPTIKPLALAKYLATLLLPPDEYAPRRIFIPFAGVASECIGAMQAGWDEVVGVELTEEYIPIAKARVEHWQKRVQTVMNL